MSETEAPIIAERKPIQTELEEGKTYYWCQCGRSAKQPFCNGAHKGTSFTPMSFTAQKTQKAFLCQCKRTANPPFCDGSHARMGEAKPGDPAPIVAHEGG